MRLSWPHVKDPVTKALVAQNKPFPVSACWNGVVAFPAGPYLYSAGSQREDTSSSHAKRGWKMIDDRKYELT
jgi:hypothetical protein